jgi:hypothetical protein
VAGEVGTKTNLSPARDSLLGLSLAKMEFLIFVVAAILRIFNDDLPYAYTLD